ncbi:UNVERIFIED_CONTAM: hypothetical protein FKN15_014412 [Acipenser sinensis]
MKCDNALFQANLEIGGCYEQNVWIFLDSSHSCGLLTLNCPCLQGKHIEMAERLVDRTLAKKEGCLEITISTPSCPFPFLEVGTMSERTNPALKHTV